MSVTFYCPDAPTRRVTPYPDQDPDFQVDESVLPEINLANGNAGLMVDALQLESSADYCAGQCNVDALPAALQRAKDLRDTRLLSAIVSSGSHQDTDYVQRTAARFVELFEQAMQHQFTVCWG